jgi:hypothetical protein
MRLHVVFALAAISLATASVAQTQDKIPREIGNRANGFSYQPTPSEVLPREQQAGVRPSAAQQKANDAEIDRLYNSLMRDYQPGQSAPQK